jgi:dynein heavy chain
VQQVGIKMYVYSKVAQKMNNIKYAYVWISFFRCFQLELTSNYNHNSFLNDMRRLYFNAGVKDEGTTLLFTDTQIVKEEFLDDISNILNSGKLQ